MLEEIYLNNFVLIDELRLEFDRGLNVLTGETGAGKSIIIDAVGLIIGERLKNDYLRDNSRKAVAEAVFNISKNQAASAFLMENALLDEEEEQVIISREISPLGRSSARLNGRNVSLGMLKQLSPLLLDIHLQHEHLSLLHPERYLMYVDSFAPESPVFLKKIEALFLALQAKRAELLELKASEQEKNQKIDFLDFQIGEIEGAALQSGEEEELLALKTRIENAQKLSEGSLYLQQILYNGEQGQNAYDLISSAIDTATVLKEDEYFSSILPVLEEIYYSLEDIARGLGSFSSSLDFEAGILEKTEDRLYEIRKLKKKYGDSIEGILKYLENARRERALLERSQEEEGELEKEIEKINEDYCLEAARLTEIRGKAALRLQEIVNNELIELNLPNIRFEIAVEPRDKACISGLDRVEFMFSPNPGEELRPVSKIASGGEISRFVLAMKEALAKAYDVPTLIFDEIDVGVGGTSLMAMAAKLSQLSCSHQLILVTHSPQIAAYARQHYLIEKSVYEGKTFTTVKVLDKEEKIKEIARMMSGDNYSALTLQHARELVEKGAC
jgi:DNA repair protein RecN (Recombination protein N)